LPAILKHATVAARHPDTHKNNKPSPGINLIACVRHSTQTVLYTDHKRARAYKKSVSMELPLDAEAYVWWPVILYMFYLMSVVCDDYLLPAVDAISARFHIPDDVAGSQTSWTPLLHL